MAKWHGWLAWCRLGSNLQFAKKKKNYLWSTHKMNCNKTKKKKLAHIAFWVCKYYCLLFFLCPSRNICNRIKDWNTAIIFRFWQGFLKCYLCHLICKAQIVLIFYAMEAAYIENKVVVSDNIWTPVFFGSLTGMQCLSRLLRKSHQQAKFKLNKKNQ